MPSRPSPLPVGLVAGQTGVVSWMERLNTAYNEGADAIIIPAIVGGGSAAANATMIDDAISSAPAQSVLRFRDPGPVAILDGLPVVAGAVRLLGAAGRYGTRLVPTVDTADPILDFDVPVPGDFFDVYGPSVENLSIDMRSAPSATGIRTSDTTGWFEGNRIAMIGGAVHVDNRGTNSRFERLRLIDAEIFFDVDGETGLELTLKDIDCTRYSAGTTTHGIRVLCTTGGTHGDLRIDNVVVNSALGGAAVSLGLLVSSVSANLSVPVFANQFVVDNAEGPGVKLVNVRDVHIADSWLNSAAGVLTAVEIAGGGNLKFSGNTYFGGTRGTYEFTGSNACVGFISKGNYCPSAYVYRLTGAGKPTDMFLDDFVPGATVDSQITDDLPNLVAGVGKTWGAREFKDHVHIQQDTVHTIGTGSEPAFANSWVNEVGYAAYFYKDSMDVVHLSGQLKSGVAVGAFTLPAGFRPTYTKHFTAIHDNGTVAVLEVTSGGVVQIYASFPATTLSIDCSFLAGA